MAALTDVTATAAARRNEAGRILNVERVTTKETGENVRGA